MAKRPSKKDPIDGDIIEPTIAPAPVDSSQQDITDEQQEARQEEASERKWPEATETRHLPREYNDSDLARMATEMSAVIKKREGIKRQAKDAAAAYKSEVDGLDTELAEYATDIKEGKGTETVLCQWEYETSGRDGDGNFIFHPEMKTLFRIDTGAVITVSPITDEERQMEMTLGSQPGEWEAPEETLGLPGPGESDAGEPEAGTDAGESTELNEPGLED